MLDVVTAAPNIPWEHIFLQAKMSFFGISRNQQKCNIWLIINETIICAENLVQKDRFQMSITDEIATWVAESETTITVKP